MFILNKKTKTIQECRNNDAIKVCKGDPDNYAVAETKEALTGRAEKPNEGPGAPTAPAAEPEKEPAAPEAEHEKEPADNEEVEQIDLSKLKLNELRKIAKEKGIQGYNNMDTATLRAVIQAH